MSKNFNFFGKAFLVGIATLLVVVSRMKRYEEGFALLLLESLVMLVLPYLFLNFSKITTPLKEEKFILGYQISVFIAITFLQYLMWKGGGGMGYITFFHSAVAFFFLVNCSYFFYLMMMHSNQRGNYDEADEVPIDKDFLKPKKVNQPEEAEANTLDQKKEETTAEVPEEEGVIYFQLVREECKKLVGKDKLQKAFQVALDHLENKNSPFTNRIVLLQMRYVELKRQQTQKLINPENYIYQLNPIVDAFLEILDH